MTYVRIKGRNISAHWLRANGKQVPSAKRLVRKRRSGPRCPWVDRAILATFFMPEIPQIIGDRAQTRVLNLNRWDAKEFAREMAENYAVVSPDALPTFFQAHP